MKIIKNNFKKNVKINIIVVKSFTTFVETCHVYNTVTLLRSQRVVFALLHFFWISEIVSLSNSLHIWVNKDATADNETNKTTWNMSKKKGK